MQNQIFAESAKRFLKTMQQNNLTQHRNTSYFKPLTKESVYLKEEKECIQFTM